MLLRILLFASLLACAVPCRARDWVPGDLFIGLLDGLHEVRTQDGTLVDTLVDGSTAINTGCAHQGDGTLYTTNFGSNEVVAFAAVHPHAVVRRFRTYGVTGVSERANECLEFLRSGDLWVGHASGGQEMHLYGADGTLRRELTVGLDQRGSDWFDLTPDESVLWYTSEGLRILRFDLVAGVQLPDFATLAAPAKAFALRLLPPGDGTGGLLVAADTDIRLLDASGAVVRRYDLPGCDTWFALALDPDGRSFWSADTDTSEVARFDIATGARITSFNLGRTYVGGLCIFGELRAAEPCGDGNLDAGEQCDDGNRVPGDGCSASCALEPPCSPVLPEVDRLSLRVRRTGAAREDVEVSFDASAIPANARHANVYRGSLAAFRSVARYDHGRLVGSCGLPSSPFTDAGAAASGTANGYYLAVYGCREAGVEREGSYGQRQVGAVASERPSATALGTAACP